MTVNDSYAPGFVNEGLFWSKSGEFRWFVSLLIPARGSTFTGPSSLFLPILVTGGEERHSDRSIRSSLAASQTEIRDMSLLWSGSGIDLRVRSALYLIHDA